MGTPSSIGRYRIIGALGNGAMGMVWLAEDPVIRRKVAIKTLRLDPGQDPGDRQDFLARLRREAEVSGRMNHPGIVAIYDVGESSLGPFLAMEYVHGNSLDKLLKNKYPLSLHQKLEILASVADALDHAHLQSVVHRDVKPGNIMIPEHGRPKLLDFGIAKLENSSLTATGTFMGTPSYVSPEQVKGLPATPLSDQFSFAVMAFEMFTGVLPFQGDSINAILYNIVNGDPAGVSIDAEPALVEGWHRVFSRALAKQPQDRYPCCRDFLADLAQSGLVLDPQARESVRHLQHGTWEFRGTTGIGPLERRSWEQTGGGTSPGQDGPELERRSVLRRRVAVLAAALVGLQAVASLALWQLQRRRVLRIRSEPPGVEVQVDGRTVGFTEAQLAVPPGSVVRLEKPGFVPRVWKRTLFSGQPPLFRLEPTIHPVRISTDPPGASLVINGTPWAAVTPTEVPWDGGAPTTLELRLGDRQATRVFPPGEDPNGKVISLGGEGQPGPGANRPLPAQAEPGRSAAASSPQAPLPRLLLLSVGLSRYQDPSLALQHPARDAARLAAFFRAQKGQSYQEVQVRELLDERATRDGIQEALEGLAAAAGPQDVVMVLLAGHAVQRGTGAFYFLPYEANLDRPSQTLLLGGDLVDLLRRCPGTKIVFLDTAHGASRLKKGEWTPYQDRFVADLSRKERGLVVLAGSRGTGDEKEDPAGSGGHLVKALLEGLGGRASRPGDGSVSWESLKAYVSRRIRDLTSGAQQPCSGESADAKDLVLARTK